jgi:hypothetical protein
MNKYIVLNGKRYAALAKTWGETYSKPMTVRQTLLGETDATYGPGMVRGWTGDVKAYAQAPSSEWGTLSDLMDAIETRGVVSFTDHYGNTCNVHITGPGQMQSLHNMWDAASHAFYVPLVLTRHVEVL